LLEPYLTFAGGGYGTGGPRGPNRGGRGRGGVSAQTYRKTLFACHAILRSTKATIGSFDWRLLDWPSLGPDDFVYFDPPYLGCSTQAYRHDAVDHAELVAHLKAARYKWMLSEYPAELYLRELGPPVWSRDVQLLATNFHAVGGKARRTECVWTNYPVLQLERAVA
jgi:hypothetical protein